MVMSVSKGMADQRGAIAAGLVAQVESRVLGEEYWNAQSPVSNRGLYGEPKTLNIVCGPVRALRRIVADE